ncbi:LD-carboxypeptidase LdcB/DacB [Streptococcus salivarius]|uniref:LD-carboxypeptidase LdcB/DacB n=1 Tax=Streptococcus salivarius TaxID=1304 RepID=UPI001B7D3713|nr:LD-carboxypeptidase LdcB/DacB [Streptococcus salivarius]
MKREKFLHEQQRFSIRKYSFGAASVLLGASLVFAGQALADEHHEVSTPSNASVFATSDSDAVTAADIFSGVATNGVTSSEKASQVSTTSETATSEATSEVSTSTSQATDKTSESTAASSEATSGTNASSEKATNLAVSALTRAAVNTSLVSQPATTTDSDLPSQGTYVYKERTEVKNQPKVSAKAEFYVNPGDSVLYDQVVTADGYQWISYKSYFGVRRYAPVKPVAAGSGNGNSGNGDGKPSNGAQATTGALDIPATGTYYFTRDTDIKKEPKADLKPTFVFGKGDHVIYDKVLTADNHQWISYLGYDYVRYYADVATLTPAKAETPTVKPTETNQAKPETTGAEKLPASGTYNVTRSLNVKNEPKASAETLYTLEKGYKVNYDKVLTADNHQWISYISYSGTRRYVDIAALKTTESKPQENRVSGTLTINNQTSTGFDVVVTNVSGGGKEVKEVRVPIWSDKNGQDDLTWYHADKQSDGSYKVHVDTASHKGDAGTYSVHLYYMLDGKRTYITETKATVPQSVESQVTGKLTISNQTSNGFDVVVTNVSGGGKEVKEVRVPIWSDKNGQDDLTWYHADKQSDGSYKVHVDTASHKGDAGTYSVHLYYMLNGKRTYITETKATVPQATESQVTGKLTISNQTSNGFDVVVTNVSGGGKEVKEVRVPIWSDKNGQDDLTWYHADKQSDGSYKVHVDTASHKGDAGTYSVHLYYMLNGKRTYITETKATVPQVTESQVTGKLTNNGSYYSVRGKYDDIIIVNKKHGLSKDYNPGENPTAKAAFVRLRDDMINQGLNVGRSYSGFRSYDYQKTLYDNYVSRDGQAAADRYSARPGYSEHQTGLVFDLTDKSGNLLEDSRASQWLKDNAHNYGFIVRFQAGKEASTGYMPEAWHIRYVGKEAKDIHDSGLSLEEYFGIEGGDYTASSKPAESKPAESKPAESKPATIGTINLPATGTYTFTGRASIKAEAKVSSPELAYYDKGMSVNYDKVLTADGRQWLSYVTASGARRYVDIAAAKAEAKPEVKPVAKPADKPSLPESGTYTFTGRASIKAEAKVSSPELAYYDKGMTVNYDKVLTADGRQWLSYVTASGARRYVDIATVKATETKPEVKPVAKPADKPSLPESGTYTFTSRASIKAEAKVSSPELAYYDKGMTVNYDKVLTADGRQWLSYVTTSGARRYVDIAAAKPEASQPAAKPSLPESGRYTFTSRASIKAEAKVSSPELAYYDKGMSVNYDKVLTADGHTWLSYMTVSGARRYVDIA